MSSVVLFQCFLVHATVANDIGSGSMVLASINLNDELSLDTRNRKCMSLSARVARTCAHLSACCGCDSKALSQRLFD